MQLGEKCSLICFCDMEVVISIPATDFIPANIMNATDNM